MFASHHFNGTTPSSNDKLNTVASGMLICCTISNSTLGGIPSTQCDLLSFISHIFSATILGLQLVVLSSLNLSLRTSFRVFQGGQIDRQCNQFQSLRYSNILLLSYSPGFFPPVYTIFAKYFLVSLYLFSYTIFFDSVIHLR